MLVTGGFVTKPGGDAWLAVWEARSKDPDTFLFLPPVFDLIGVKRT